MKIFFNQKGINLAEVMVVLSILGIVSVGIMKQMDFQMKTQSHMNQKMTTDLFNQGLKELLSSEEACKNSLGGIKLSAGGGIHLKELKDHKGKVLYKTTDSTSSSGKNKIDETIKIKSMKVLSFTKDEDSEDEGFLTLELELEKLNKSFANQVFTRKIDAIRGSVGPNRFSFKAAMTTGPDFDQADTLIGFSSKIMGSKYIKAEQITSGARLSDLFLIRSGHENNIYFIASKSLSAAIDKIKIRKKEQGEAWKEYNFPAGDGSPWEGTYYKGVPDDGFKFIEDEEYEVEVITGDSYLSSCRYVGMRGVASLEKQTVVNSEVNIPGCEATNSPEVKCGGNKVITESIPALNHQDTHELIPRKVINGDAECICRGNFICDGLTLNSNNKGTLLNKGVTCIPKTLLSDFLGICRGQQTITYGNCTYRLDRPLFRGDSAVAYTTTRLSDRQSYKGLASIKCNAEGRLEVDTASKKTCSRSTCPIYQYQAYFGGGPGVGASVDIGDRGRASLWRKRPGAEFGINGEVLRIGGTSYTIYVGGPTRYVDSISCTSGSWVQNVRN